MDLKTNHPLPHEIETPFLAVDLAILERNIARMAKTICKEGGKSWRPHVKAIKSPAIAHMMLAAGASGVTCAKLSEAEVMVQAGIRDVLIANQIIDRSKLARLVALNRYARVLVGIDDFTQAQLLNDAAAAADIVAPVLIELDIGIGRCGVEPGAQVVELAQKIASLSHVKFCGLMGWEGHATTIADPAEKDLKVREAVGKLVDSAQLCREGGLDVEIVSAGGTGTYAFTAQIAGVTEIQAGGGAFGDIRYRDQYHIDHECALTVCTTVISRPSPTRIIVDAGWKAMSNFPAMPEPIDLQDCIGLSLNAEHTRLDLAQPSATPRVGDRISFIVGYSDSTVFLHDTLHGTREGRPEQSFPLLARGKLA